MRDKVEANHRVHTKTLVNDEKILEFTGDFPWVSDQ